MSGIIFSDASWTAADSPINITGPTAVAKGVTLTVEPGAVVKFNMNVLQVNGTFQAIGTSTQPVTLDGGYRGRLPVFASSAINGKLILTSESEDWDAQTGTGCIFENAKIISLSIFAEKKSVKITNNIFSGGYAEGGAVSAGGNSLISNNKFVGGSIYIGDGSPLVSNNTLIGRGIGISGGSPTIVNNLVYTGPSGITVSGGDNVTIIHNAIANMTLRGFEAYGGNVMFEHNLVLYSSTGCLFGYQSNVIVQYNTIALNRVGLKSPYPSGKFSYNNVERNSENSVVLSASSNVDFRYNWWGTTDASAISQTIFDYKNNYNLGNVTFIPFLDSPNPQAPSIASFTVPAIEASSTPTTSPEPTATPSTSPLTPSVAPSPTPISPSYSLNEQEPFDIIAVLSAVITALIIALVVLLYKQRKNSPKA